MSVPRTTCPNPQQLRSSQICQSPPEESHYVGTKLLSLNTLVGFKTFNFFFKYNASRFDEPSQYKRSVQEVPKTSYIDLTEETQYVSEDMDISGQDVRFLI